MPKKLPPVLPTDCLTPAQIAALDEMPRTSRLPWTQAECEAMRRYYPQVTASVLAARWKSVFGRERTIAAVQKQALILGIRKT